MNWIQINCRAQKNANKKKEAFQIAVFSGILVLVISALVYKKHKDKQKKSQQTIAPIEAESFDNKEFLTLLDNLINDENQKNNLQTLQTIIKVNKLSMKEKSQILSLDLDEDKERIKELINKKKEELKKEEDKKEQLKILNESTLENLNKAETQINDLKGQNQNQSQNQNAESTTYQQDNNNNNAIKKEEEIKNEE